MRTHDDTNTDRLFVPHLGWLDMPEGDDVTTRLREGWFEPNERAAWTLLLREGDTVVDAGAHAGLYAVLAATRVGETGRVVAVEPNPALVALAQVNLSAFPRAAVERVAVWDSDTTLSLHDDPRGGAYGSVSNQGVSQGTSPTQSIPGRSLASIAESHAIDTITLLKLDVEGAELEALRGAGSLIADKRIGVVMIELTKSVLQTHARDATVVVAPLIDAGYTPCRFDPDSWLLTPCDIDALGDHENLFLCADTADANERLGSADDDARAAARDTTARGAAALRLADAAVERDHMTRLVDTLRAELNALHDQLATQRKRSDTMLLDQEHELRNASEQWDTSRDSLAKTIDTLNGTLTETQSRWAESDRQYEQAISGVRGELDTTRGELGTLRDAFERAQVEWEKTRLLYEDTIASLKAQLLDTHAKWAETREAYEASLAAIREQHDADAPADTIAEHHEGAHNDQQERTDP